MRKPRGRVNRSFTAATGIAPGVVSAEQLDVVIVVTGTPTPFIRRAAEWDLSSLPVPVDLLVYTDAEWQALPAQSPRLARTLAAETVWIFDGVPPRPTTPKAAV
jgi:hypothetical protein